MLVAFVYASDGSPVVFRSAFHMYIVPFLLTGAIVSNLVESFEVEIVDG